MYSRQLPLDGTQTPERLTDEEVRAVVARWADRRSGPAQASLADVAEGLDISVEEAQGLLAEARAARAEAGPPPSDLSDGGGVLAAYIMLGLMIVLSIMVLSIAGASAPQ